jgi:hypothetical protein
VFETHYNERGGYLALAHEVWDIDQVENDRLVWPEHFSSGNSEESGVANVTGSSSDCDSDGLFLFSRSGLNAREKIPC